MKISRFWLGGLALMSVAGCAHRQKTRSPVEAPVLKEPESPLAAIKMPHYCLGRAMHASMAMTGDAEADKKAAFDNYFEAFLDAREQEKFLACLDEDRADKDYEKSRREGQKWLDWSRSEAEKYGAFFPPEKQIVDVQEKFTDLSDKRGARKVVITLKDGSQAVSESQFDR